MRHVSKILVFSLLASSATAWGCSDYLEMAQSPDQILERLDRLRDDPKEFSKLLGSHRTEQLRALNGLRWELLDDLVESGHFGSQPLTRSAVRDYLARTIGDPATDAIEAPLARDYDMSVFLGQIWSMFRKDPFPIADFRSIFDPLSEQDRIAERTEFGEFLVGINRLSVQRKIGVSFIWPREPRFEDLIALWNKYLPENSSREKRKGVAFVGEGLLRAVVGYKLTGQLFLPRVDLHVSVASDRALAEQLQNQKTIWLPNWTLIDDGNRPPRFEDVDVIYLTDHPREAGNAERLAERIAAVGDRALTAENYIHGPNLVLIIAHDDGQKTSFERPEWLEPLDLIYEKSRPDVLAFSVYSAKPPRDRVVVGHSAVPAIQPQKSRFDLFRWFGLR